MSVSMHSGSWPALSFETLEWRGSPTYWPPSARPDVAKYKPAIPPLIAGETPRLSADTSRKAELATLELSRFDAEMGYRVAEFAPILLRSEAASSSQIENLTASARSILTAELGAKRSENAALIVANTRMLRAALDLAGAIDADAILAMHQVLMENSPRHTPGQWRSEPVWIGTSSASPVGADYVAPAHSRVPGLIEDLATFAGRADVPALTAIAIVHAQFETIHPFTDGNGRTGRALAQSQLRYRGVTRTVAVPVSAGLLSSVEAYHEALTAYRSGEVDPIILAFADASMRAVENARILVAEIDEIRSGWEETLTLRKNSRAWDVLDVIVRRPVLDAATAAREIGVEAPNAYPALNALADAGILTVTNEYRLGRIWRSDAILDAIDAFAARAGRREWLRRNSRPLEK